jgi:hypothetical protein
MFSFCSMNSAEDIANELEEGLARLFQRGLDLALRIQDDAMAAESAEERARLGGAFHRISRGVRQTAALRIRLANHVRRAGREDQAEVARLDRRHAERRKAQVKATVERLIWTEAESEDAAESLVDGLESLLEEDDLYGRLADGEVEAHIARLSEELGLSPDVDAVESSDPSSTYAPAPRSNPGRGPPPIVGDHPIRSSA